MDLFIGAGLAIGGGLIGQVVAYFFTKLNAAATNEWNRNEKLRQERILAYSEFAGAANSYRRAMHERARATVKNPGDANLEDLVRTSRRSRDVALQALYLVELLCDHPQTTKAAHDSYRAMDAFSRARNHDEVEAVRDHVRDLIRVFVETARTTIDLGPDSR